MRAAEKRRVTCPTCGRQVAVRWCNSGGYVGLYDHRVSPHRGWCSQRAFRPRCPVHDMPDCSPLLNGCARLTGGGAP